MSDTTQSAKRAEPTPGPWRVETNRMGAVDLVADGPNGEEWLIAAAVYGPLDWREKNFALLAAAPDLLAACRAATEVLSGDAMTKQSLIDALALCRAAIDRATGGVG